MVIKQGKSEGWLQLDTRATRQWLESCGVKFNTSVLQVTRGRGNALVATEDLPNVSSQESTLLTVPEELVLSCETVKCHAQYDQHFREVLECLGEFGQASMSCPNLATHVGVRCQYTDYVKTLPCEALPTFWSDDELDLLVGTTLAPAISSKLSRLRREYDTLCSSASSTKWFQAVQPHLEFEDWLHVDAMYRSRALEFHGSCMIPGMDLASHAAGEDTNAFYDRSDGLYHLWLIGGKTISKGEEVLISYGDEKGACEMIFSYGFLDEAMETAETLFLSISIPGHDKYRSVKARIADCAPGFKIIDVADSSNKHTDVSRKNGTHQAASKQAGDDSLTTGSGRGAENETSGTTNHISSGAIDWKGDFVWLLVVNEEDGLSFEVAQTVEGKEEVQMRFCDQPLENGAADLRRILSKSALWDVYRLRAVVILQQRVYEQLQLLYETQEQVEAKQHDGESGIGTRPYWLAMKLRRLEFELLEKAYEDFEAQKVELAQSTVVTRFLAQMQSAAAKSDLMTQSVDDGADFA